MYFGVKILKPLANHELLLTFENGEQRVFDVKPYSNLGIFRELADAVAFNSAHITFDTVEWANGADLDPETLYASSVPLSQHPDAAVLSAVAEKSTGYCPM